jgi:SAM-dependent methyltransferase
MEVGIIGQDDRDPEPGPLRRAPSSVLPHRCRPEHRRLPGSRAVRRGQLGGIGDVPAEGELVFRRGTIAGERTHHGEDRNSVLDGFQAADGEGPSVPQGFHLVVQRLGGHRRLEEVAVKGVDPPAVRRGAGGGRQCLGNDEPAEEPLPEPGGGVADPTGSVGANFELRHRGGDDRPEGPGLVGHADQDTGRPPSTGAMLAVVETSVLAVRLRRLADYSIAFAIRAASSLGVADRLAVGPRSVDELAVEIPAHGPSLGRLLRALAVHDVVEEVAPDRFGLRPMGELLRSDHPLSLRDAFPLSSLEAEAWGALDHSVRTGRAAFEHVFGTSHRAYRAEHPEEDRRMDRVHAAATRVDALTLLRVYDWRGIRTVVDVGGGTGAFLAALLSRSNSARGVLFDLPRIVMDAPGVLAAAGVADRCEIVGGDFFERVPSGADVYVLKAVLGGWDDDSAAAILATVRRAMRPDSRLLIIEPIQRDDEVTVGNIVHLGSLVLYGGPERTRDDYERLLARAGLRLRGIVPRSTLSILEATTGGVPHAGAGAGAEAGGGQAGVKLIGGPQPAPGEDEGAQVQGGVVACVAGPGHGLADDHPATGSQPGVQPTDEPVDVVVVPPQQQVVDDAEVGRR